MLVGGVEGPYGTTPNPTPTPPTHHTHHPQDFLKSTFSIDFYALSGKICCQKQITCDIVKIAIFKMAAMKNAVKWKIEIYVNFYHNRWIYVFVEK